MPQTISISAQSFPLLRENSCFYMDKTDFIRTWRKGADVSTRLAGPFDTYVQMTWGPCTIARTSTVLPSKR